ncbi:hypothetical protein [Desulfogranum mediterraneum]|uniref:hypothetical protein n=1 Tax=Desulfogranum mediterraneum TaxID=160661 RepID=UPI0003FD4B96|nr:hypothetical protein [Desulfogranum mediterraneum]
MQKNTAAAQMSQAKNHRFATILMALCLLLVSSTLCRPALAKCPEQNRQGEGLGSVQRNTLLDQRAAFNQEMIGLLAEEARLENSMERLMLGEQIPVEALEAKIRKRAELEIQMEMLRVAALADLKSLLGNRQWEQYLDQYVELEDETGECDCHRLIPGVLFGTNFSHDYFAEMVLCW